MNHINYQNTHFSPTAFYRIKIPTLLSHLDRILYLDIDTLVVNNLHGFYDIDLEDKNFVLVHDIDEERHAKRLNCKYHYNTGVMLFNIKRCLNQNIEKPFMETLLKNPALPLVDQDIINIVFQNEILAASDIYNTQILSGNLKRVNELKKNFNQLKILHYVGRDKPWSKIGNPFEKPFVDLWKISPWKNQYYLLKISRLTHFIFKIKKLDDWKTIYVFCIPVMNSALDKTNNTKTTRLLGIPLMTSQKNNNRKVVKILGIKVVDVVADTEKKTKKNDG